MPMLLEREILVEEEVAALAPDRAVRINILS
jgi:hypothetical protein